MSKDLWQFLPARLSFALVGRDFPGYLSDLQDVAVVDQAACGEGESMKSFWTNQSAYRT